MGAFKIANIYLKYGAVIQGLKYDKCDVSDHTKIYYLNEKTVAYVCREDIMAITYEYPRAARNGYHNCEL